MVEPSRKFKQIDRCHSPIEKIYCLKETSDLIMKTVANNISPGLLSPTFYSSHTSCSTLFGFLIYYHVFIFSVLTLTNASILYNLAGSDLSVTTDDLIPFLVYIIVLSKPKHMKTNLFFMENLTFINLSTSQMG